ncbi:acyl-CoA thioesterase [Salinifilum ghardaiensis]
MGAFAAEVPLRWADVDAFGHVNHATMVTLLEQARAEMLFAEAERHGLHGMSAGMVVARVVIDYHSPLFYADRVLRVRMSVREVKAASFVVDYTALSEETVASAETLMVPYDLGSGRPRRLTAEERAFLGRWRAPGPDHPEAARPEGVEHSSA